MHAPRAVVLATLLLICCPSRMGTGKERQKSLVMLWWNVENLFDTHDDPKTDDDEFTPQGRLQWTAKKLLLKQVRIGTLLRAVKSDSRIRSYPDVIAFAEVENQAVFAGTLATAGLGGYLTVCHESPDPRGIDIGLAWNPRTVAFTGSKPYRVRLEARGTREVIVAGFSFRRHPFSVVLNHWPSRSFDADWTEPNRIAAAKVARHIVDSLRTHNPKSSIIVMGDFNDPPASRSVRDVLGSTFDRNLVRTHGNRLLYNCWNDLRSGGSYAYRGKWERIDQILVSEDLLGGHDLMLAPGSFGPFFFPHMLDPSGKKLYPTYEKGHYRGGYSDHLPLLLKLGIAD